MSGTPLDTGDEPHRLRVSDVPVSLFGHPSTSAELEVEARTRGWRARKALLPFATGVLVAPLVALIPPHAPWFLAALATGAILAGRRWREAYTIRAGHAPCPRCGATLSLREGTRLRFPHPLTCPECGHEPVVEVTVEELGRDPTGPRAPTGEPRDRSDPSSGRLDPFSHRPVE